MENIFPLRKRFPECEYTKKTNVRDDAFWPFVFTFFWLNLRAWNMSWNTDTGLQIWNWSGRCRCKDAKNNKYVLNTLTGLFRLVATEAHAGQNLLSGTRPYSQQCHPSPRGRRGARLCPLVFALLSASEGELTCRIAEPSSPAAHSPSLPHSVIQAARNPKHTWAAGLAAWARPLGAVGTSAVRDLQRWPHSSAHRRRSRGHRSRDVRINTLHH